MLPWVIGASWGWDFPGAPAIYNCGICFTCCLVFSPQPPSLKALSLSPMSSAWECKTQDTFASSQEQDGVPHQVTVTAANTGGQCQCLKEEPNGAPQKRTSTQNGMQDSGGTGVKKKRKKKDQGEQEGGDKTAVEVKPKRRREPKEPKEPKKVKESKKPKEPKQREVAKKPRKPREPKAPKEPKDKKSGSEPAPRSRPKKIRWVMVWSCPCACCGWGCGLAGAASGREQHWVCRTLGLKAGCADWDARMSSLAMQRWDGQVLFWK